MKNLFIPFVLLVTTFGYGQISRGTIFLGGSVNVAFDQVDSDKPDDLVSASDLKRFSTTIQPYVGIFLSEKWQIGGGLAFNYSATNTITYFPFADGGHYRRDNRESTHIYSIDLFATRYIRLTEKLFFTATLDISGGKENSLYEREGYDDLDYKSTLLGIDLSPGLTYFFSDRWAAVTNFGRVFADFRWRKDSDPYPASTVSSFGVNMKANTFSIGVQYYLNNGSSE